MSYDPISESATILKCPWVSVERKTKCLCTFAPVDSERIEKERKGYPVFMCTVVSHTSKIYKIILKGTLMVFPLCYYNYYRISLQLLQWTPVCQTWINVTYTRHATCNLFTSIFWNDLKNVKPDLFIFYF